MRLVLCGLVLVFAVGCGSRPEPTKPVEGIGGERRPTEMTKAPDAPAPRETPPAPKAPPVPKESGEKKPAESGPPISIDVLKFINEYKDHELAADAKYKGKRIEVKVDVRKTGRTESGEAYIGSVYGSDRPDPPIIYYVFPKEREVEVAKLKIAEVVTITGTCVGRVNDGKPRMVRGLEFYIRVEDCSVKR